MAATEQPLIAVTLGDPAGIGPEIVAKYIAGPRKKDLTLVVVGEKNLLADTARRLKLPPPDLNVLTRPSRDKFLPGVVNLVSLKVGNLKGVEPGRPNAKTGRAAIAFVEKATDLVMLNEVDAVTTGPISKHAVNQAGFYFPGHTDYFASRTNTSKYAMCFIADDLRVALVTTHTALRKVHSKVKLARVVRTVCLLDEFVRGLGVNDPRLVVTGLNPHAGENGLLGTEELQEIAPAVEACRTQGLTVDGPASAEAAFAQHRRGRYDGLVAMYHDQGLIPVKVLFPYRTVNVTLGLPFVRTSVGHGAGLDIAGQGLAKVDSLRNAVNLAAKLVRARLRR
ncbi:MAG: 4-hydroxythreonine-4-phosphate dehydrogenase PdxA [Candidatus Coatesbacteria bacterium]|nr:MAG: 4-hydroxythreonine-4-phosphate dehydrogenase PdxA [Candidatus Coatesbacteria bacterium]